MLDMYVNKHDIFYQVKDEYTTIILLH